MPPRPRMPLQRYAALAVAGTVSGLVALSLGGGAFFASACSTTLAQPDSDAGTFPSEEGGHPHPVMGGSPCLMSTPEPELCCGNVAKKMSGKDCYGCTTKSSYAICVGGAFTCACECDVPVGYTVIGRGSSTEDEGGSDGGADGGSDGGSDGESEATTDGACDSSAGATDARMETGGPEAGPADAAGEASGDAPHDAP